MEQVNGGSRIRTSSILVKQGNFLKKTHTYIPLTKMVGYGVKLLNSYLHLRGFDLRFPTRGTPEERARREFVYLREFYEVFRGADSSVSVPVATDICGASVVMEYLADSKTLSEMIASNELSLACLDEISLHLGASYGLLNLNGFSVWDNSSDNVLINSKGIYLVDLEFAGGELRIGYEEPFFFKRHDQNFRSDTLSSIGISGYYISREEAYEHYSRGVVEGVRNAGVDFSWKKQDLLAISNVLSMLPVIHPPFRSMLANYRHNMNSFLQLA